MLQESAVQHYGAFLEVAQSLSAMREEVRAIGAHLDALRDDLPGLNDACTSFTERASDFAAKRSQNKQLQRTPMHHLFSLSKLSQHRFICLIKHLSSFMKCIVYM